MKQLQKIWILPFILFFPLAMLSAEKGDVAKGKELFQNRCAVCHGSAGEGKEAMGKVFGVKIPVLSSKEVQFLSDSNLKTTVLKGRGKMQAVALSDQEILDAIAFLRSLKK
jgi:mono/diheme cytochrome c family protein